MRRIVLWCLFIGFVATLALTSGCGEPYRKQYGPADDSFFSGGGSGSSKKATEELASDGWTSLEGQILYDGELPQGETLSIQRDVEVCLCEEAKQRQDHRDQTWLGKKRADGKWGVANVVVYLKAPEGKHFKIHEKYRDVAQHEKLGKVVLDQPFCAYEPRVVVLYPSYSDGKQQIASGQVFEVKNSAAVPHNTKIKGNPAYNSDYDSSIIGSGRSTTPPMFRPQDTPLPVSCDVHSWMRGYVWAFDHPYAARTDAEGKFKIDYVPAGAEVALIIWHEGIPGQFLSGSSFEGKRGKRVTFSKDKAESLGTLTISK